MIGDQHQPGLRGQPDKPCRAPAPLALRQTGATRCTPSPARFAFVLLQSVKRSQAQPAEVDPRLNGVPVDGAWLSLPTRPATVTLYTAPESWSAVESAYEANLLDQPARICAAIPRDQLAIQCDTAIEFGILKVSCRPTLRKHARHHCATPCGSGSVWLRQSSSVTTCAAATRITSTSCSPRTLVCVCMWPKGRLRVFRAASRPPVPTQRRSFISGWCTIPTASKAPKDGSCRRPEPESSESAPNAAWVAGRPTA